MKIKIFNSLLLIILLQGCSGIRYSYKSIVEESNENSVIFISVGETEEIMVIGDGFPGWWGYYPSVISSSHAVASVKCNKTRSFIPFREPGIIFGGEICYLSANKQGEGFLFFGNKWNLTEDIYREKIKVIVTPQK